MPKDIQETLRLAALEVEKKDRESGQAPAASAASAPTASSRCLEGVFVRGCHGGPVRAGPLQRQGLEKAPKSKLDQNDLP